MNLALPPRGDPLSTAKTGLMIGAVAELMRSPQRLLTLQAELVYSEKGVTQTFDFVQAVGGELTAVQTKDRFTLEYLELPVVGRLSTLLPNQEQHSFHLVLGPALAVQTGCRRSTAVQGVDLATGRVVIDDDRNVPCGLSKGSDVALIAGGGLDLVSGSRTIVFDVRYTHDLFSIARGPLGRNRVLTISIGSAFMTVSR